MAEPGDMDLPEGWEVKEEHAEPKKDTGFEISNRMMWALFALVFIVFIAFFLMGKAPPAELTTVEINGVKMVAEGSPYDKIRALPYRSDLVGVFLNPDEGKTARNVLLEIGEILKTRSSLKRYGTGYEIQVGISDRTGVFVHDKYLTIEGEDEESLWKAGWAFAGVIADTDIVSETDLWQVSSLMQGVENVSIVVDLDEIACSWAMISGALGNVNGAVGFVQSGSDFVFHQYIHEDGECELQFTNPDVNLTNMTLGCPDEGPESFVINLKGDLDRNKLVIRDNAIDVLYKDCNSMISQTLILRDVIAPQFLTGIENVVLPVYW